MESLALASLDVGRIDVAQVSSPHPNTQYPRICIWGGDVSHHHQNTGMFNTPIRRIPGVATSAVSRRHLEGGDGRSGACATLLRTVARGGPVQFGVFDPPLYVISFCQVTEKEHADIEKAVWKRQISVLRKLGKIKDAVEELSKFADTFYTDVEAWLELADIYASNHQYAHPRPLPARSNSAHY